MGQSSTTMNYVPREKGQGEIETVKISPIELLPMISPLKSFLVIYFRGLSSTMRTLEESTFVEFSTNGYVDIYEASHA
jgi:hypothetical protein